MLFPRWSLNVTRAEAIEMTVRCTTRWSAVRDRLNFSTSIYNPVDGTQELTAKQENPEPGGAVAQESGDGNTEACRSL